MAEIHSTNKALNMALHVVQRLTNYSRKHQNKVDLTDLGNQAALNIIVQLGGEKLYALLKATKEIDNTQKINELLDITDMLITAALIQYLLNIQFNATQELLEKYLRDIREEFARLTNANNLSKTDKQLQERFNYLEQHLNSNNLLSIFIEEFLKTDKRRAESLQLLLSKVDEEAIKNIRKIFGSALDNVADEDVKRVLQETIIDLYKNAEEKAISEVINQVQQGRIQDIDSFSSAVNIRTTQIIPEIIEDKEQFKQILKDNFKESSIEIENIDEIIEQNFDSIKQYFNEMVGIKEKQEQKQNLENVYQKHEESVQEQEEISKQEKILAEREIDESVNELLTENTLDLYEFDDDDDQSPPPQEEQDNSENENTISSSKAEVHDAVMQKTFTRGFDTYKSNHSGNKKNEESKSSQAKENERENSQDNKLFRNK